MCIILYSIIDGETGVWSQEICFAFAFALLLLLLCFAHDASYIIFGWRLQYLHLAPAAVMGTVHESL